MSTTLSSASTFDHVVDFSKAVSDSLLRQSLLPLYSQFRVPGDFLFDFAKCYSKSFFLSLSLSASLLSSTASSSSQTSNSLFSSNPDDVAQDILEYLRFMHLKADSLDTDGLILSPSPLIDVVWHAHLLHTRSYADLCRQLFTLRSASSLSESGGGSGSGSGSGSRYGFHYSSFFLHHRPEGANEDEDIVQGIRYRRTYSKLPDEAKTLERVWPLPKIEIKLKRSKGKDNGEETERSTTSFPCFSSLVSKEEKKPKRTSSSVFEIESSTKTSVLDTAPVCSSERMTIRLKTMTGRTFSVVVSTQQKILSVKEMMREGIGIAVEDQRYVFVGKVLEDTKTVSECGLRENNTVMVVGRLRGC